MIQMGVQAAPGYLMDDVGPYGFEYPAGEAPRACRAQVTRVASIERSNGLYRILQVATERHRVNVYISPSGRLRVYDGAGGELVPQDPISRNGRRRIARAKRKETP